MLSTLPSRIVREAVPADAPESALLQQQRFRQTPSVSDSWSVDSCFAEIVGWLVERVISSKLLDLNARGYLHKPLVNFVDVGHAECARIERLPCRWTPMQLH